MLRISKLTDYGTVVLAHLVDADQQLQSASEIAAATGLGAPTVSKLLKQLARAGLVASERGANGGYRLAQAPQDISAAHIIDALEGPLAITECSGRESSCELEENCSVGSSWQQINRQIRRALAGISLTELQKQRPAIPTFTLVPMSATPATAATADIGREDNTDAH
ncbi:MAG TPA: SUF system Fe-S cluster assembly regulator [Woeseiaceae bacterium]|nr:SUF system Fe-S cluster assembly regulator [Woeseiaceae bacterium]